MINSRIPEPVRPILKKYISLVEQKSPGLIRAFYIVGSIALNGFNERFSDIDFVAILDRPASPADVDSLRTLHKAYRGGFSGIEIIGQLPSDHRSGTMRTRDTTPSVLSGWQAA